VEDGVGALGGAQEGQAEAIRKDAAARRAEGDVGPPREGDPERPPVEATVEEPEAVDIDVDEDAILLEGGEVERELLDRRRGDAGAMRL
jgi:hypothetical protein